VKALGGTGATIALHYRQAQKEAEILAKNIPNVHLFQADLADPVASRELVPRVIDQLGGLQTLVNNAGVVVEAGLNHDPRQWQAAWEKTLQVNLIAAASCSRKAIEHMRLNGGGRLIHIASRAAFRGDTPEYIAYAASKAGMVAMSRSMARYYGKDEIKSFVIAPGFTRTAMAQEFIDQYGEEIVRHDLALNDLTEPEDIAPTVVFMASGLMDHATGCAVDINAGSYVR
ncbi:MAG: SDR family oxidoreductase, partial [Bacteroidota bacterium]